MAVYRRKNRSAVWSADVPHSWLQQLPNDCRLRGAGLITSTIMHGRSSISGQKYASSPQQRFSACERALAWRHTQRQHGPARSRRAQPVRAAQAGYLRIADASQTMADFRSRMEEDEQLSVLMAGLRGANMNASDFADEDVVMQVHHQALYCVDHRVLVETLYLPGCGLVCDRHCLCEVTTVRQDC